MEKPKDLIFILEEQLKFIKMTVTEREYLENTINKLKIAINYTRCCCKLKDLKGNEIEIKSLSDLKKMYPKGTTFSVAGNGRELNYYVNGEIAYTRTL